MGSGALRRAFGIASVTTVVGVAAMVEVPVAPATTVQFTACSTAWVVPSGIQVITVDAYGGRGGSSFGAAGGSGAHVTATVAATPGESLTVHAGATGNDAPAGGGGAGGCNGGGNGGSMNGNCGGGGGGGFSDVRRGTTVLVLAGGGGGAGGAGSSGGAGGNGGTPNGTAGQPGLDGNTGFGGGGGGGTQSSGGGGGAGSFGPNGGSGDADVGGSGGSLESGCAGGGGGGGYFGGGGGGAVGWFGPGGGGGGGGGGGSSHVSVDATSVGYASSPNTGGSVTITYGTPTAVRVSGLAARRARGGVALSWSTGSANAVIGFAVYREGRRVNRQLILAAGQGASAHGYWFLDREAPRGRPLVYRLRVIAADGTATWAGTTRVR